MIERTPLSDAKGKLITDIKLVYQNGYSEYHFFGPRGRLLFQVSVDHLYDKDGNRFDTDDIESVER